MTRVLAGAGAALLLLTGGLTGCSIPISVAGADEGPPAAAAVEPSGPRAAPGSTLRQLAGDQRMRLDLPTTDTVQGVALYFHGQSGDVDGLMDEPWLDGLAADGWAVASADFHLDNWGSPASVRDAVALADWAAEQAGAPIRLLIGGSMGGLASLNALIDGALAPRCWFGSMPVVDLRAVGSVPQADAQVQAVYGGPPPASSNPGERLEQLPSGVRYVVVHSTEDTWVPSWAHSDRLVAALRQAGAEVSVLPATGEHGDPSLTRPGDLREAAAACR